MVGIPRFELGTSSLSATRSNQLSYMPGINLNFKTSWTFPPFRRDALTPTVWREAICPKKINIFILTENFKKSRV